MSYSTRILLAAALLATSTYAEDPWTPSPLCPYPSEDLTRAPYEGDCSKYWECYEGARYPMDCPHGLEFNNEKKRCDDPALANCDPDATIIYPTYPHSTHSTASTAPTQDPGPAPECPFPSDELVFFPVVNNCSQYWECFQGNRYLMNCPPNLFWNVLANYCDFKENVDCNQNNVTTPTTPTPPTTSTTPTTPGDNTTWTSTTSTTEETTTWTSTTSTTEETTTWTSTTSTTESPNTNTTPPTPTTVSTPSTSVNPICKNEPDGTYFANPDDCSRFYECVSGRPVEGKCAGDLVWNEPILSCDYPWNVNCGQ